MISCGQVKIKTSGLLPAGIRYRGPVFLTIHKALRDGELSGDLDIRILSAEFGLLTPLTPIPWYDRRMDSARARELRADVLKSLDEIEEPKECLLTWGKDYRECCDTRDLRERWPGCKITDLRGRSYLGILSEVKKWVRM